jgi:hypothetical protein
MKDVLTDIVIYRDYMDVQRRKQLSYSREFAEIERAKIIPENVIEYPEDWPEISYKRGVDVAFAESAMDRRTLATLDSRTVPAIFEDSPLESVVTYLASVTDLNFDVDWASLDSIGIDRQTRVSMNARNVSAKTVLDRVLSKVSVDDIDHAGWQVQDGIVVVASEDDLARNTFVVVYDVRDLLFDPNDYRELPELDLDAALRDVPGEQAKILLCHNPVFFPEARGRVALQLSGHTHGGQVNLGFRPADLVLPYVHGEYVEEGSRLYVNRGFGTAGPPSRVDAPPEVTVVVLVAT